jgi:hypothetical protein
MTATRMGDVGEGCTANAGKVGEGEQVSPSHIHARENAKAARGPKRRRWDGDLRK